MHMAREAIRNFRETGAVAPSSRALSDRLTDPLTSPTVRHPARFLEVGSGTGAVTRGMAARLHAGDHLDLVEYNPRFTALLTRLLASDEDLIPVADRVSVLEGSITEVGLSGPYAAIVCGLPFMNFDPPFVRTIMNRLLDELEPGGSLTYYRYLGTTTLRRLGGPRRDLARHLAVLDVMNEFDDKYGVDVTTVWPNIPPATVHHLRR